MNPSTITKNQKFNTIGDLRAFIRTTNRSPEALANEVPVSNMTWRRLLQRPDSDPVPEKYRALLERNFSFSPQHLIQSGFSKTAQQIEEDLIREGLRLIEHPEEAEKLLDQTKEHATRIAGLRELGPLVKKLGSVLAGPSTYTTRALILGSLLYFLNPFDLIADSIVGIGFLDDLGILHLAASNLAEKSIHKGVSS